MSAPLLDVLLVPVTLMSAAWSLFVRCAGMERMPIARRLYLGLGVLPIRNHYYDPFPLPARMQGSLDTPRQLPGIEMNEAGQLDLLTNFNFQDELDRIPLEGSGDQQFYYRNSFFGPGDADFLYSMIRYFRPRRIVEVGSGYSTLVMLRAIDENRRQNPVYQCEVTCVEPYEADWLESRGVTVIRRPVEEVGPELFSQLESDDILFIDSSHVIKPRGDVLFLYLQVLPLLSSGVLVQIHDVFTPRDYLKRWVVDELKLWNEQYLLEAFLSHNRDFRIIGALNYLKHRHQERLAGVFPILGREPLAEPGSLWLRRA